MEPRNLVPAKFSTFKVHESRGRPRKELSEKKKEWMFEFLGRSDITHTNPGRQDNVYVGKVNGERQYLPRQYLLWTLRDLLDIVNGTSELLSLQNSSSFVSMFTEKLTFSQIYDFIKSNKQFIFNKNIPHTSCLCDICENVVMLAKGLNNSKRLPERIPETPHDLVEQYSCSTDQKSCMYNECTDCSNGKLCESLNNADSDLQSDSDSDSDSYNLISFYRWETPDKHVSKVRISVNYDEAIDRFKESVTQLKRHIYSKRSQNRFYNGIKESLDYGQILVHVNYAESYKNSQQDEIQSAYFGNNTFSIFTACCYTKSIGTEDAEDGMKKDSFVVVSESNDHNRAAALTCLKKVILEAEKINIAKYSQIFVWSDGCAAQFRSRFVFRLLTSDFFDNAELTWGYNEKSHGKGPMDGVGGTVKNVVFRKVKSGLITISTPFEFHEAVQKFVPSINSIYLSADEVLVEPENIVQEAKKIDGTQKIHHIERFQVKGVFGLKFYNLQSKGVFGLKFYNLAEDSNPFHTEWYANGKNVVICGHETANVDSNHCASCFQQYDANESKEWIQCPALCTQWFHEECFYH